MCKALLNNQRHGSHRSCSQGVWSLGEMLKTFRSSFCVAFSTSLECSQRAWVILIQILHNVSALLFVRQLWCAMHREENVSFIPEQWNCPFQNNMTCMLMFLPVRQGPKRNTKASCVHTTCKIVKLLFEH